MADDAALAAKGLATQIEACSSESAGAAKRRELFGKFARLRNKAEDLHAEEALKILDEHRPKLKIAKTRQSMTDKISMYLRLVLTLLFAFWGSFIILVLIPLRFTNPIWRRLGVPNGKLPMDLFLTKWAETVLAAAGVKVKIEGSAADWVSNADLVGIIVYNHASNLDPFIVSMVCHAHAPKYIGKKVLFMLPVLGWLFVLLGMVPLNRGNREKAVQTMNEAVANIMKKWSRSVAISPEGTRTTDGHLRLPFKKGVFHLQEKTKVPLLPIVIQGAYELWPSGRPFTAPGVVTVNFMPPQYPVEAKQDGSSHNETRVAMQQAYSEALAKDPAENQAGTLSWMDAAGNACYLLAAAFVYRQIGWVVSILIAPLGLGAAGWTSLFVATTLAMAFAVEKLL